MANTTDDTNKNLNDEDNFGLPEIEYKPLDQLEETPKTVEEVSHEHEERAEERVVSNEPDEVPVYDDEEESRSSAPIVITVIIALVVLIAGILIYQFVYKPKQEKARQEQASKEKADAEKKAKEERIARQAEEDRLKREAEVKAKPAEGAIETLSARTGHYYVIIASSIDGDLVMDQAKKLSAKGVGSKIIPPFGKWKFYRLGIGDFDSFSTAQSSADASKAEYGNALWVMKY
jgi:hypothetical protein